MRINRLIIEGADLTRPERAALPAAAQRQLALLLAGHPPATKADGTVADQVAAAVAAAIHRALPAAITAESTGLASPGTPPPEGLS